MRRYAYAASGQAFLNTTDEQVLGHLVEDSKFDIKLAQRSAWMRSLLDLRHALRNIPEANLFLEFTIPRMGRRADAIIVHGGCIFVVEYKVGANQFFSADIDQTYGYALDLKHFHEPSHNIPIIPILIATEAPINKIDILASYDKVCSPILAKAQDLEKIIINCIEFFKVPSLDANIWANGRYKPTPTIIEAAQALYENHNVKDITRNEAGAENLSATAEYLCKIIDDAKQNRRKALCLLTGVAGAGKTLAGLNIANIRTKISEDEHAVFLSGNGPLVDVLRAALVRDQKFQAIAANIEIDTKTSGKRSVNQFIQNIHHFRDANLDNSIIPIEKVAIFDEAQRAWDLNQTSKFMRKRGVENFSMSEPHFLLSVMDRHKDWCVVICLIGHGQEINTGEAGLREWLEASQKYFPSWNIHASTKLLKDPLEFGLSEAPEATEAISFARDLHLSTSIRSFRSEVVSDFVSAVLENMPEQAKLLKSKMGTFEFVITRELGKAKSWLKNRRRGTERSGLLAFSNAIRLKPEGIFVKNEIDPVQWFLNDRTDVRSSDYLEDVSTEFAVQGLELDWACVCIDANLRYSSDNLVPMLFKGTRWQNVNDEEKRRYIVNAHRVLLTRARQGTIIYIPKGDQIDLTRNPSWYDDLVKYFYQCGIKEID